MSLRFGILGLLDFAPMTGYNLKKVFDRSVNNVWTANLSQIYRELGALEKGGYVSSRIEQQDDRPDKKIYSITPEGRRILIQWLKECPDTFVSPKRDEFMLKLFFGSQLEKDEVINYLERFIEDRRTALAAVKEPHENIAKVASTISPEFAKKMEKEGRIIQFILKRAVMTNQLLITWAQDCIEELNKSDL